MNCAAIIVRAQRDKNAGVGVPLLKKDGHSDHPFSSRRGDSNARPPRPERGALPTALLLEFSELRKKHRNPKSGYKDTTFFAFMQIIPTKNIENPANYAYLCIVGCISSLSMLHVLPIIGRIFPPVSLSQPVSNPYSTLHRFAILFR